MEDPRAESRLVEGDSCSGAINPQLRLDARHAGQPSPTPHGPGNDRYPPRMQPAAPVSTPLHVSTIEVYGELAADREHFTEGSPLNEITNLEIVNRSLTGLASTPPSGG